jgi:phosphate transport system protein
MQPHALSPKYGKADTLSMITAELIQLEEMVNNALIQSIRALLERDETLARAVSLDDDALNQLRNRIEERCYIALEQGTLAHDPRTLTGIVNVVTNLERIGDYAARIAYLTQGLLRSHIVYHVPPALPAMVEVARELVEGAVEAYLSNNDLLAERVVRRDRELVELYEQVYHTLHEPGATATPATLPLTWITTHLERVGERAISICERTVYNTTGEIKEFR